ncbi:MAG TPA: ABC transporter ATP-binding protein [Actinomycetota bacterium]|nr:ABC transporter ATP-binding protein [Actinomycetota bacterium]
MTAAVEVEGLTKRFGPVTAVRDVSFRVEEGESFGYLGPNGAGKTTTIRCLLGLVRPTAGRLQVLGHDVPAQLGAALAEVGYLPGEFGLWPNMTGEECLDYLASLHPRPPRRREELCERFELSRADLRRQVRFYSRGMRQKVGIVQAFQHDPALAILDEPTEGLDPVMKSRFIELIEEHRRRGGTIFLSSHILSEVEATTERVGVLREGRLVRVGPTSDLRGDRIRHCTLVLGEPVDLAPLRALPGVSALQPDGPVVRFEFRGEVGPLLERLTALPVRDLLVEPERLSEAFFDVYEGEGG